MSSAITCSYYWNVVFGAGSYERVVFLNTDDVKLAVKRFGHPDSRNAHPSRSSPNTKIGENEKRKPIGGVPVLLNMTSKPSPPPKPRWMLKTRVVQQAVVDTENCSDSLDTSSDDEYIAMTPAPLRTSYSLHTIDKKVAGYQSGKGRKVSAPEILLFSVASAHPTRDGSTMNERKRYRSGPQSRLHGVRGRPRSHRSRTPQGTQPSGTGNEECSSLDLPCNQLSTQATLRVQDKSKSTSYNLLKRMSTSVPNLLSSAVLDLQMTPSQSQSRSLMNNQGLAHSSEDMYEEVQDVLSLDSPLLHRVSTAFSTQDDRPFSSSSSDCGSCSGSSGDLTSTHQSKNKVSACYAVISEIIHFLD